jgi:hypothetical protein
MPDVPLPVRVNEPVRTIPPDKHKPVDAATLRRVRDALVRLPCQSS